MFKEPTFLLDLSKDKATLTLHAAWFPGFQHLSSGDFSIIR